ESAASGDSNLTSTRRLLRTGDTVRSLRNRSIVLDCVFVSSTSGESIGLARLNHPPTNAAGALTTCLAVSESFAGGLNSGWFHSFSASIVRRARARLCSILYCV